MGVEVFEAHIESSEAAARQTRDLTRDRVGDIVSAAILADVLTVMTELVTNAVRHGEGSIVRVRVAVSSALIRGEVENDGAALVEPRELEARHAGGLGLHIVSALVDGWSVVTEAGTTLVRFELGLASELV